MLSVIWGALVEVDVLSISSSFELAGWEVTSRVEFVEVLIVGVVAVEELAVETLLGELFVLAIVTAYFSVIFVVRIDIVEALAPVLTCSVTTLMGRMECFTSNVTFWSTIITKYMKNNRNISILKCLWEQEKER